MSKVDRNQPKRARGSESSYTLMDFMHDFPDDRACLDWLWRNRYSDDGQHAHCPKCERERKFHRVESRPSYCCGTCGHHIHPTAGTIMHRSATSLKLWFYAIFLMTSTRCAVSAKHLERELGVTYKCAWRMANLIRNVLMDQDDDDQSRRGVYTPILKPYAMLAWTMVQGPACRVACGTSLKMRPISPILL